MNKLITPQQMYRDVARMMRKAEKAHGLRPGELAKAIARAMSK